MPGSWSSGETTANGVSNPCTYTRSDQTRVAFMDFVDVSIVNTALPSIATALRFSVAGLQWVPGGYLLTYGGFMLLGGRAADLLGRRRILLAGVCVIGASSLVGGLATSEGVLIGARLFQGLGAATTLPAALSVLTTSFPEGRERHAALGFWGAIAGLSSAVGAVGGGLLTEGPDWRWVMLVNPIACLLLVEPVLRLISDGIRPTKALKFDLRGALLVTGADCVGGSAGRAYRMTFAQRSSRCQRLPPRFRFP